jgi:hypothetical protein
MMFTTTLQIFSIEKQRQIALKGKLNQIDVSGPCGVG